MRSTKPEIFMSVSLSVLSQNGPLKSVERGSGGGGGGRGRRSNTTLQLVNFLGIFFIFLQSDEKLDGKSIENGLEGEKCSVGYLFWGWLQPP